MPPCLYTDAAQRIRRLPITVKWKKYGRMRLQRKTGEKIPEKRKRK